MSPAIFVTSPIHESALIQLRAIGGVSCGFGAHATSFDQVSRRLQAVLVRAGSFTAEMMDAAPALKIIARHGAGVDSVDIEAATARGIWVTNTPGANGQAVAEHVFALLLALARKVCVASDQVRNGLWGGNRMSLNGVELEGRTMGLVGFGSIGRIVARIAQGFGMKVIVSDPALKAGSESVEAVSFDDLLARSDVISLHAPLLPSTRGIIDAAALARMRKHAILINTGRGGLVDEAALVRALAEGGLAGAALDVLDAENIDMTDPLPHSAIHAQPLSNLIITPHLGGQTEEALVRVGRIAVEEIRRVLAGARPLHAVNLVTGAPENLAATA